MQRLLKIRLETSNSSLQSLSTIVDLTQRIEQEIKKIPLRFCPSDFKVLAHFVDTETLKSMVIDHANYNRLVNNNNRFCVIEIENAYSTKDTQPNPFLELSFDRYKTIYSSAKAVLREKLTTMPHVLTVRDYQNMRVEQMIANTLGDIGVKYRLYLDNTMLIERFFPYNLLDSQCVEENVTVLLDPGKHSVKVETFALTQIKMSAMVVDNKVFDDINNVSYSFVID